MGIDNDPKAITDAKTNIPSGHFSIQDGRKLSFENNSFDFVLCMTTPANFGEDKDKFYLEMKRVIKPEGVIIISVFNEDAFNERMKLYNKLGAKIKEVKGTSILFTQPVNTISEQFSKEELEEIFNRNGLRVLEIKKEGIGYFCKLKK